MLSKTIDPDSQAENVPTSNRLIVLAGVSVSGKTTLLSNIMKGKASALCQKMGLKTPQSALYINNSLQRLQSVKLKHADEMVIDFDFLHYATQKRNFEFDLLRKLIYKSKNATVITLCAPSQTLYQRFKDRLIMEEQQAIPPHPLTPEQNQVIKEYKQNILTFYAENIEGLFTQYQSSYHDVSTSQVNRHFLINSQSYQMVLSPYNLKNVARILCSKEALNVE